MSAAFDTLKLADRLGAGGFTAEQAHTAASALSDVLEIQMATKADVETAKLHLEAKMREVDAKLREVEAKIQDLRLQIEAKIQEMKSDLIRWVVGTVGFQTLVILGSKIFTR